MVSERCDRFRRFSCDNCTFSRINQLYSIIITALRHDKSTRVGTIIVLFGTIDEIVRASVDNYIAVLQCPAGVSTRLRPRAQLTTLRLPLLKRYVFIASKTRLSNNACYNVYTLRINSRDS